MSNRCLETARRLVLPVLRALPPGQQRAVKKCLRYDPEDGRAVGYTLSVASLATGDTTTIVVEGGAWDDSYDRLLVCPVGEAPSDRLWEWHGRNFDSAADFQTALRHAIATGLRFGSSLRSVA